MMNPIVEKWPMNWVTKKANPFKSLDVDENQQTAADAGSKFQPLSLKKTVVVDRIVGFTPEPAFKSRLSQYID